ncbi:hemerythrin domain-containing protein [Streptomyces sp. ACA25]|uniref:hemerythrin domain-containing protein n=1 Tax=Streptomyces sp. ACA25 TaxID=3022596 RepID=UPI0023072DCE|nr:hemerythrin domain-containing protein [Streptomyces sp. ACA25]MDB1088313.1 hemerythrin domain-containing protein [Streptomyces sp. ACA25]
MTALKEFTEAFSAEHRQVRDLLLELVDAFGKQDIARVRALVGTVAEATGPHFRYEEEAMYPQLVHIFGTTYVEKLLADHDGAIRNARELLGLSSLASLTPAQAARGVELTREILPHVSDCEGLSIMVETFPEADIDRILTTRAAAQDAGLDLLTWAATERDRRA